MDFLQTYPQVAEYVEEFNYFGSLSVGERVSYILDHPILEMGVMGFVIWSGVEIYKMLHQPPQNPWTFGNAKWATMEDVRNACKTNTKPGMLVPKPTGKRIYLAQMGNETVEADIHVTCIGANGTGKGTSLIIPNCFLWKGSLVVNDIKGENYQITHEYRRDVMGQDVFVIDPYNEISEETNSFNPMDYIDSDETGLLEARKFAEAIFPEKENSNLFFDNGARNLITITMLYVKIKYPPEQQNIATVRNLLTLTPEEKMEIFLDMQKCDNFNGAIRKGINTVLTLGGTPMAPKSVEEAMKEQQQQKRAGEQQKNNSKQQKTSGEQQKQDAPNETVLDLYATADVALQIFDDIKICKLFSKSDMKLHMLKYIPQTIYLVISASNLKVSGLIMQLMYKYAIDFMATSKRPVEAAAQNLEPNKNPTLFLLDEFAQLKKFLPVKEMMPLGRGYGVRFLTIVQGLKQLEEYYSAGGDDFLTNATKIYLGAEDTNTAEEISKFCNTTTVRCDTTDLVTKKKTVGWQGVPLITVGQVLQASPLEPFILKGGVPPIRAKQLRYFENPMFKGKYKDYTAG